MFEDCKFDILSTNRGIKIKPIKMNCFFFITIILLLLSVNNYQIINFSENFELSIKFSVL